MIKIDYEAWEQFEKYFEEMKYKFEYIRDDIANLSEKLDEHIKNTNDRFVRLKDKLKRAK